MLVFKKIKKILSHKHLGLTSSNCMLITSSIIGLRFLILEIEF